MLINGTYCDSSIGVRGLCESYTSYLDDYGISLSKTAKLADSSKITGKELIDSSVKMAWKSVLTDLSINGFKFKGVTTFIKSHYDGDTATNFSLKINRNCDFESLNLKVVKLFARSLSDVTFNIHGDGVLLYTSTLASQIGSFSFDFGKQAINASEVILTIASTGDLANTTNESPFALNAYLMCDERILFCQYSDLLEEAVRIKASALILNSSIFSDRYNDLIVYKSNEIALRISQLDSDLNLLNGENKINKKGLYQIELEKISLKLKEILVQYKCGCCFECQSAYKTLISLP